MTASPTPSDSQHGKFMTTRWSVVVAAGQTDDETDALAELCHSYWQPLYRFVRRSGYQTADAQDLTQAFFERLIERRFIEAAQQERGRFRTFLLASLKNFAKNEWRKATREKRGGGRIQFLDFAAADKVFSDENAKPDDLDAEFDRDWAVGLLDNVLRRLKSEFDETGKSESFDKLSAYLSTGSEQLPYQQTADASGMSVGHVKVSVHRMRARYRELLEQEIANTVNSSELVEEELRYLFNVMSTRPTEA